METGIRLEPVSTLVEWREWHDHSRFQRESCAQEYRSKKGFRTNTSSLFATTPWAVNEICKRIKPEESVDGRVFIEVGSSSGPLLQKICRSTKANIRYIIIESNKRATDIIKEKYPDERLEVYNINCKEIAALCTDLGIKAHWILTSFPMTNDLELTRYFLEQCRDECLDDVGRVLAWNYLPKSVEPLVPIFGEKNCDRFTIWRNMPPLWSMEARSNKGDNTSDTQSEPVTSGHKSLILPR